MCDFRKKEVWGVMWTPEGAFLIHSTPYLSVQYVCVYICMHICMYLRQGLAT